MGVLLFVALGCAVGAFGALMGIGGGLLVVPVFLYLMGFSVPETVGTSLVIVCFNALSGTFAYARQHRIERNVAIRFGLATIPGAILGSFVVDAFSGKGFQLLFGCFLLLVAGNMFLKSRKQAARVDEDQASDVRHMGFGTAASTGVGFLSSILGIGGGVIHVPLMNQVCGISLHRAIATSSCILFISSLAGILSHGFMGHVLWMPAVCVGIGALAGAQFGAACAKQLNARALGMAFSLLVLGIGLRFISAALV